VNAILLMLARPLIEAAVTAFGRVILDFLKAWQANADAKALGRAQAINQASEKALHVEREMGAIDLPEQDELLRRLREGTA
jgi:hypothetical protein